MDPTRVYPEPTQYKGLFEMTCPLCDYLVHSDRTGCYEYMLFHTYRQHVRDTRSASERG